MINKMKALFTEEQGQGMTEYGLVLGVIAVAAVAVLFLLGDEIQTMFNEVLANVQSRAGATTTTTP
ncbi:Flp family type IVb pilin [Mesobacillus harenae]|uniref:Flp family type IVb pilin n=1 Tax=Mesobacillus harenae TaxID=2213203 RepID=UPI001580D5BF|nr:Flp family type IVb pilin [Mesobacillus harenae]